MIKLTKYGCCCHDIAEDKDGEYYLVEEVDAVILELTEKIKELEYVPPKKKVQIKRWIVIHTSEGYTAFFSTKYAAEKWLTSGDEQLIELTGEYEE